MRRKLAIRALGRVGLFMLALGAAALVTPGLAAAANPACGSTVKHNVALTSDMSCPGGNGIVVGKSGITINLNHFALQSDNTCCDTIGVDNSAGYNNVTVENGPSRISARASSTTAQPTGRSTRSPRPTTCSTESTSTSRKTA